MLSLPFPIACTYRLLPRAPRRYPNQRYSPTGAGVPRAVVPPSPS